jgi:hypothetical protein
MFYAIENPYGNTTINNGTRATRYGAFSQRRLRDAWVNYRPTHREAVPAHDPALRARLRDWSGSVDCLDDEAWYALAEARVLGTPALYEHRIVLLHDWGTRDHWRRVAIDPVSELVVWAREAVDGGWLE